MIDEKRDLVLDMIVDLSPEQMFRAWTDPELLPKWFCPPPWHVSKCNIDLRPGGLFYSRMEGPDGLAMDNYGTYLEIVPNKKITWTDALTEDFRPTEKSFITATLTLTKHVKGTHYHVVVRHKSEADRIQHEQMGFKTGWGIATEQMVKLMKSL
jgi:uncharacterized protein YndB with AHSA1/START domain